MQINPIPTRRLALAAIALIAGLAACGPAAVQTSEVPTPAATAGNPPAQATLAPSPTTAPSPTSTAAPSSTPTATAATVPTATETALPLLAPAADGLDAWCLLEGQPLALAADPAIPADGARLGEIVDGALEIRNLPVGACVFTYTFNQPPPDGLKLEIYERSQQTPWWTADLLPVEGSPNAVSTLLRHTYIVAPPLWEVSFEFVVRDAAGSELRRDLVNLRRWTPELCWNGRRPNPITLRCPLPQDLHPWDAGYGTPIPTFPPDDEDE
jgi:hypothetical protein